MTTETLNELLPKAEAGDVRAQEELAFAYVDQDKDYTNAVKWLEEAERQGHLSVRGAYTLAISYDDGRGEIAKDPVKAEHYYRIAADSEEDNDYVNKACFWLASGHWTGEVPPFGEDDEVAVYYLERLLTRQSTAMKDDAMGNLALLFSFTSSPVFNPEKSKEMIEKVKDSTDEDVQKQIKDAQENLAHYEIAKAAQEIMQAAAEGEESTRLERAENGDPTAQFLLYIHAPEEEQPKYEHFLISSAESGYLPAQTRLVGLWAYKADKAEDAIILAKKVWDNPEFHSDDMYSAIKGTIAYTLGDAYYSGSGTTKDEAEALKYLSVVAESEEDSPLVQDARIKCAIIMLNQDSPTYNVEGAATRAEQVLYSTDTANKEMALRILIAVFTDTKRPKKNIDKAIEFATMASQVENPEIKKMGEDILATMTKRKEIYDRASHGDAEAMYALSEDDFFSSESAEYLEKAAQAGNPDAQVRMAFKYMLDDNESDCFKWALKAYNSGARHSFVTWKLGYAYATGENAEHNPAIGLKYLKECADMPTQSHDVWVDKARAFLMMELCNANGMFGENTSEAVQYAETVYCDSDSDFRDEALKVLILSYGDIDCSAFDQQKAIMYTKMGLDSTNQEVKTAAQNVKNFYHQIVVREVVNRDQALKNGSSYQPSQREQIASAINQALIHYKSNNTSSGTSSGGSGSSGKKSGGCYIATSVYGSYDCPQVWPLRRFRDNKLALSAMGRSFIRVYYAISPHIVKRFGNNRLFRAFWKAILDNWVIRLQKEGYNSNPYQDR